MPPGVEVSSVQLPGRENRISETPHRRIDEAVDALLPEVAALADRPYAFFGHSMGALLAFELARRLRTAGFPEPERLFVAAHRAPQLPSRHPPMSTLSEQPFVDRLRSLDGTPEQLLGLPEVKTTMFPTLRADFAACETYTFADAPLLDCPIVAYTGLADPFVDVAEAAAWAANTSGPFTLQPLPGNHFSMLQPPLPGFVSYEVAAATGSTR